MMFFGRAHAPRNFPTSAPLQKVPKCPTACSRSISCSRACPANPRSTCRTACRAAAGPVAELLKAEQGHIFICGLKGMEAGRRGRSGQYLP